MSLQTRIAHALAKEDPATEVGKIIPHNHQLLYGLLAAVRFEKNFIGLRMSEVPLKTAARYYKYLDRCQNFSTTNPLQQ
jgi:hypothetical protein